MVHKLRLQDAHPAYMSELITVLESDQSLVLGPEHSASFLFGENKARSGLSGFWRAVATASADAPPTEAAAAAGAGVPRPAGS